MKKNGFTLAEVLMTMTIIGVIASMTLPTLTLNTRTAQIGPKLATAVASFEQANQALLAAEEVDSLTDLEILGEANTYSRNLIRFLKGNIDDCDNTNDSECTILLNSGTRFYIPQIDDTANIDLQPHQQRMIPISNDAGSVGINILIDCNSNGENCREFQFSLWNDGSLKPKGGVRWDSIDSNISLNIDGNNEEHWSKKCPNGSIPEDASYCAGSIFENNLRVRYRM